jgi:uncharacterized protein YjaG (DUF416 family)
MTKKENKGLEIRVKSAPKNLIGSDDSDFLEMRLREIIQAMWMPKSMAEKDQQVQMNAALESLEQIAPQDGVEGMLAVQMIATHQAAVECLRRAMISEQTFEGRNSSLKHGEKFMRLYLEQVKALNKHRGKGDQKMTVEHVNIEPGGQAIVGQVSTNKKK